MKSAANKSGPATNSPLSHIPLPRRKSANKGVDVEDTDSELSNECVATRSQAKMSLLGGTSFCCASGQKEDYMPDSHFVPALRPPKKRPPNVTVKKENLSGDLSTSSSPLLSQGRSFFSRNKRDKVVAENSEGARQALEADSPKSSPKDSKAKSGNSPADSRLRLLNDKRKITPPSPQRRSNKEPSLKDQSELKKCPDSGGKLRKDTNMPCKLPETNLQTKGKKDTETHEELQTSPTIMKTIGSVVSNEAKPVVCFRDTKRNKGYLPKSDFNPAELVNPKGLPSPEAAKGLSHTDRKNPLTAHANENVVVNNQSEDLDCPCCDTASSMAMEESMLEDMEITVFASCDAISTNQVVPLISDEISPNHCDNESVLQREVRTLREDLQDGKQKLQVQHSRVQCLEEELMAMQQLKEELEKEKELRKIAEDKLLELLDHERRMDILKRNSEKCMESKSTQMDLVENNQKLTNASSPSLFECESQLRKYQTYIAKLEKDNLMLVNELKKFKDLSPRSQEEQAKFLVDKLGQMERSSHQQQLEYETCLDEVANKLVQTLLVQKRLEEECKILHLRVEQLEHENRILSELAEDRKNESLNESKDHQIDISPSSVQNKLPSYQPLTSTPSRKTLTSPKTGVSLEDKPKEPTKSLNANLVKSSIQECRSPVISPVLPGPKVSSSKIPSFSSSKPVTHRKKTETDLLLPKSKENRSKESATQIPFTRPLTSAKSKSSNPNKGGKGACVKRKRPSRTGSPADKESKQRFKSNHSRWESHKVAPENLTTLCSAIGPSNVLSPITPQQQIWSFNCEVQSNQTVPELTSKVNHSIDILSSKLDTSVETSEDFNGKQNSSSSEASATMNGNRTRDEGYSTMSSDLQQDSAADTTISEPEHSSTYVISEKSFGSDDSVTECLDSSMCSSSDSGFGPLHQVSNPEIELPAEQASNKVFDKLPKLDSCRKNSTVRSKEQIASVKPTIRAISSKCQESMNKDSNDQTDTAQGTYSRPSSILVPQAIQPSNELPSSPIKYEAVFKDSDNPSMTKSSNSEEKKLDIDHSTMIDYINFPKDFLGLSYRNSWHLGPTNSKLDEKIVFCTRHSYMDDNIFDEKIQTAEKSTLTEPEEELWREKALAPFIDESIWSLYSSEGDMQVKHFPLEPLLSEPSLEKLIANCSPCIIVSEDIDSNPQVESVDCVKPSTIKTVNISSTTDLLNNESNKFKPGLERVASDTVLYLKDAIHELEDSMRRGLKSSKNIPALHQNSGSESEASPDGGLVLKPELLKTLEATMTGQNNLDWPSPSHTSSTSSFQSSASYHVISDEVEDVDLIRVSRKGSQDPDLSSASDTEYENLEHKEFVERWLQKETACNNFSKPMVPQLECVEELGELTLSSVRRKSQISCVSPDIAPRRRMCLKPSPTDSEALGDTSPEKNSEFNEVNTMEDPEDGDVKLDPEATEFNGDFYTLCSIGSLKSLDRFSPARSIEHKQIQVESPLLLKKPLPINTGFASKSDKSKPTGLVKPTRPISLSVSAVPTVPDHKLSRVQSKSPKKDVLNVQKQPTEDSFAKSNVLLNDLSVFQKRESEKVKISSPSKSSPSLPAIAARPKEQFLGVKVKSPTKIVLKSSGSSSRGDESPKKLQWRRERFQSRQNRLKEGCGTAWIHLQPNLELSDPTVRSSFLDSLKAPTSSSGSSSTEEEEEDVLIIHTNSHLHKICRERRNRVKASANNPLYDQRKRSSIMGRREFFYRFGDKEREAIACFDFLEEIPSSSLETLNRKTLDKTKPVLTATPPADLPTPGTSSNQERISFTSPTFGDTSKMATTSDYSSKVAGLAKSPFSSYSARRLRLPNLWNKPLSHNMSSSTLSSQDYELLDHISLSDSCAESYSSTPESYDDAS